MCKYCSLDTNTAVMENESFFALYSTESVSAGHMVIISKDHVDYFSLSYRNNEDLFMIIRNCKKYLDRRLSPDGYNIGINIGDWAGQKEKHAVLHLIPRFAGDVPADQLNKGILKAFN